MKKGKAPAKKSATPSHADHDGSKEELAAAEDFRRLWLVSQLAEKSILEFCCRYDCRLCLL
jgi:hypothetical protein